MQLRPCAGKPVVAALQARENLWRLQFKYGKLCNCCHARKTYGGYNSSMVNYATAAMRGKPVAAAIQAREIMQLLPCGKICGGCNTNMVNYATATMRGKNLW